MKKISHIFSVLMVIFLLATPSVASAQGLIVCGATGQPACTFKDFLKLAERVNDFLLITVMIPLATFAFGMAGVYYVWGGFDPGKIGTAKTIFWSTFQGVALAVCAWLIVNTILSFLVTGEFNMLGGSK